MLFATYALNVSPVDGTNIIRSFTAKAKTFQFPLDMQTNHKVARISQQGEAALQHIGTMFLLWFQQKELLKALNNKPRERHHELANRHNKQHVFQPGNLVLVRKQVMSKASKCKPTKLTLRARGPYLLILEPIGGNFYTGYRRSLLYRPSNATKAHAAENSRCKWRGYQHH
jgi:hypothetical protein